MREITGYAVMDEKFGPSLWIRGSILKEIYPDLNKYFHVHKTYFIPTFIHYVATEKDMQVGDTIKTETIQGFWEYYVEEDRIFSLTFQSEELIDSFNTLLDRNRQFFSERPNILWTFWLLLYLTTEHPALTSFMMSFRDYAFEEFKFGINPDMGKISRFLQANKERVAYKNKNYQPVQIKTAYGTINLKNTNNWFLAHLNEYIEAHYKPEHDFTPLPKKGAPPDTYMNTICIQLYRYLTQESESTRKTRISKETCELIMLFLSITNKIIVTKQENIEQIRFLRKKASGEEKECYTRILEMTKTPEEWHKLIRERIRANLSVPDTQLINWTSFGYIRLPDSPKKYW